MLIQCTYQCHSQSRRQGGGARVGSLIWKETLNWKSLLILFPLCKTVIALWAFCSTSFTSLCNTFLSTCATVLSMNNSIFFISNSTLRIKFWSVLQKNPALKQNYTFRGYILLSESKQHMLMRQQGTEIFLWQPKISLHFKRDNEELGKFPLPSHQTKWHGSCAINPLGLHLY